MKKPKPYKAKSLSGAQALVRALLKQREETAELLTRFYQERNALAMLAANGPCFNNPLVAMEAKQIRNRVLAEMNINPDGTYKVT